MATISPDNGEFIIADTKLELMFFSETPSETSSHWLVALEISIPFQKKQKDIYTKTKC